MKGTKDYRIACVLDTSRKGGVCWFFTRNVISPSGHHIIMNEIKIYSQL